MTTDTIHVHAWSTTGALDTGFSPPRAEWECPCGEREWSADPEGPPRTDPEVLPTVNMAALRVQTLRSMNEIFDVLEDVADTSSFDRLQRIAELFKAERDEARAAVDAKMDRIRELELEITRRMSRAELVPEHQAVIADAARTLRTALTGLVNTPLADVGSARIVGQLNKALEAFNNQTKGML